LKERWLPYWTEIMKGSDELRHGSLTWISLRIQTVWKLGNGEF
jgi:hypothetical protein